MVRRLGIDDLASLAVPEQPAISPDGADIAYVLRRVDDRIDRDVRALWLVSADGGAARPLTRGDADTAPAWSPDGTLLAFLRAQDGPPQIWVLHRSGGEPEQVTRLAQGAGAPSWSPDGASIAFVAPPDAASAEPASLAPPPIVIDRLGYKADGRGVSGLLTKQLHVLDRHTGEVRQLTGGAWSVTGPAWSPDGKSLAFSSPTTDDADLTYRSAAQVLDLAEPETPPRIVGSPDGGVDAVSWTRDGRALIVVAHRNSPSGHASLLRLDLAGGDPLDLGAALDRNIMPGETGYPGGPPQLAGDGHTVLFCVRDRGCTHLYRVDVEGGAPQLVAGAAATNICGISAAPELGRVAVVLATATSFGEIAVVDLDTGEVTRHTQHGAGLIDTIDLLPRREREFVVSDGTVVHGWLIRDPDASGPQPLLLDVHGGPHNAWNGVANEVHIYHQVLAARGWTVLLLNSRGSDGYGERFYTAVVGAWGEADEQDFLEPVDQLIAEGIVDRGRQAIVGYSYGGFTVCRLTGRTNRFSAAVAGGLISDLTSLAGTSDLAHLLGVFEFGSEPWADRVRYAALSPLSHVQDVTTPTLVLHGAADLRCPLGQAEQWYTALRSRNVTSQLVIYPEGDHLFARTGRPSYRADYNRRVIDWLQAHDTRPTDSPTQPLDAQHWQRRLSALASRHGTPGAVLGILRLRPGRDDELVEVSHGVLNKGTGVDVTTDSVFQLGSISKVWTTTVALQLVAEGLLDLDAPIAAVLPELCLADPEAAVRITLRHLLTHTSGIDGDTFIDTGRGDDCLERLIAQLDQVAQVHPVGAAWSYCNLGFMIVGRLIEKATGTSWDEAMTRRLIGPLGLAHTVTLPEQALMFRAATGHVRPAGGEFAPMQSWAMPRTIGPAGLIASSVGDVLSFARLHLADGRSGDGERILGADAAAEMRTEQVRLPEEHTHGDSWGLGWARFGWDGRQVVGHDGNTVGQTSFLRLLPEAGVAVVLLTNAGDSHDLYEDLFREVFDAVLDLHLPQPPSPPSTPVQVDVRQHLGRYERAGETFEVFLRAGQPILRRTEMGLLAGLMPDPSVELAMMPVTDDRFLVRESGRRTWSTVTFYALGPDARYLHFGSRATPLVHDRL